MDSGTPQAHLRQIRIIQERYGIAKEEAEKQIDDHFKTK